MDALSITEMRNVTYLPPNLRTEQPDGRPMPDGLVVTSPNMDWIPDFKLYGQDLRARKDGRFGMLDFTVWPQMFSPELPHLPFVLRRPDESELQEHPLSFLWWNIQLRHFELEPGQLFVGLGRLKGTIADKLRDQANKLRETVQQTNASRNGRNCQYMNLRTNHLIDLSINLKWGVHYFREIVLKVAAYQRLYLEVRGLLDNFNIWCERGFEVGDKRNEVDHSIMGAITDSPEVVQVYWRIGVPVWYIRIPAEIPKDMNIGVQVYPTYPDKNIVYEDDWPDDPFPTIMRGALPSAARLRACQNATPGGINMRYVEAKSDSTVSTVEAPPVAPSSGPQRTICSGNRREPCKLSELYIRFIRNQVYISDPSSSSTSRPQKPMQGGRQTQGGKYAIAQDKFEEPAYPYLPPASPLWTDSLKKVDHSTDRIVNHPQQEHYRGYQFPLPHLFVNSTKSLQYLSVWLITRECWIQDLNGIPSVNSGDVGIPNPMQWRDYFHKMAQQLFPVASPPSYFPQLQQSKHKNPSDFRRRNRMREEGDRIFGRRLKLSSRPDEIFWQGAKVLDGSTATIPPWIITEVLWDLYEHNFRLELRALDRCIMAEDWKDPVKASIRNQLIKAVFPGDGGYMVGPLPQHHKGVAAEQWQDRLHYIEAFRKVLSSWPGPVAQILATMSIGKLVGPNQTAFKSGEVENVENVAVPFYCQTFFDWFARAPITPHRLPPRSTPSASSSNPTLSVS